MNYQELLYRRRAGFECEPTTILLVTSLALSAVSTAASLKGQKDQAEAQAAHQQAVGEANVESARVQSEQVRDQQAQTNESSARDVFQAGIASRKAEASAITAAGEAGVSGNSVDALLREFETNKGMWVEAQRRQKQLTDVSAGQQIDSIRSNADANNLSMNAAVAQPNYLAEGLRLGAQATGTIYSTQRGAKKTTAGTG